MLPLMLVLLSVFILLKRQKTIKQNWKEVKPDIPHIFEYVGFGLIVGIGFYILSLPSPDTYCTGFDSCFHYALVRTFLDTSAYFPLHPSIYADLGASGPYYPCAWHMLGALTTNATGTSLAVSTQALNVAICSVVFPVGMLFFLKTIFKENSYAVLFGGVICVACVSFPWDFLYSGPLYSNLLSYSLLPTTFALFVQTFKTGISRFERIKLFALVLICALSSVVTQPNFIFSCIIILLPFCVYKLATWKEKNCHMRLLLCFGFLFLCACFWIACYKSPIFASCVNFNWPSTISVTRALYNSILFTNAEAPVSFLLGLFTLVGVYAILKQEENRWIVASWAIATLIFVLCAASEGDLKHLLGGFWYTDSQRIAALTAIICTPIAALGAATLFTAFLGLINKKGTTIENALKITTLLVCAICLFFPFSPIKSTKLNTVTSPMQFFQNYTKASHNFVIFDEKETEFTKKCKELVGDAIVENHPADGSFYAYQTTGLRVVHRHIWEGTDLEQNQYNVLEDEELIDKSLKDVAANPEVQQAVKKNNIEYVIKLEVNNIPDAHPYEMLHDENVDRSGISGITDDTPGFEVVLADGNYRLYKIVY